jgi:hypothetical protein
MTASEIRSDEEQIKEIVAQLFEAISWGDGNPPAFDSFAEPFLSTAAMVPSARPVVPTTISAFVERMAAQHASGGMANFDERPLGTHVRVFGNIAVALGGYEMRVNGGEASRGANAFLFVRDEGRWVIAGLAWENESDGAVLAADMR